MAHYAELDASNIVKRVIVVDDANEPSEEAGVAWCVAWAGGGVWKKCSYNGNIRKNFPGPGHTYDSARNAFYSPSPFPSWQLDEATCRWKAPTPRPSSEGLWVWDEPTTSWIIPT